MKSFLRISSAFSFSFSFKRLLFLFFLLAGFASSAWGASATVYFDNTNTQWDGANIYIFLGHDSYSRSDYHMTRVQGTKNLYQSNSSVSYWSDAKYIAFARDQWSKSGENNSLFNRLPYQGDYNFTCHYGISPNSTTKYIYIPSTAAKWGKSIGDPSSQKYAYQWSDRITYTTPKVTVTTPTNGTISLKDYDDTAVTASASGTAVPYLTVLKITATPNTNYELESVTIGGTTYTAAQFTQGMEYTVTAATTISATFKATACSEKPTVVYNDEPITTANSITINATATASGTNCTLTDVGIVVYADEACTNEIKRVSATPPYFG